jgi:hypothetical protein
MNGAPDNSPSEKAARTAKAAATAGAKSGTKTVAKSATARRVPAKPDIRAFLSENPQYLTDHPEVLAAVMPSPRHADGRITDLQGYLIARLRDENVRLKSRHDELLATSRANMTTLSRIHAGALMLLEARSFAEMIEVATTDLAVRLGVDVIVLAVENPGHLPPPTVADIRLLAPGEVDRLMGPDQDVVLNAATHGRKSLYGVGAAGLVASEALLRLHASPEAPCGLLALGSRDPDRFDPGQGTELLGFLGRVIELCIRTWLGLPKS